MEEKDLLGSIATFAQTCGWTVTHFPKVPVKYPKQPLRWMTPIRYDGKGFLDLLMLRERILVAEVKAREGGGHTLSIEQKEWVTRWAMVGVRAHVWTVAGWEDGSIREEIQRRDRRDPALPSDGYVPAETIEALTRTGGICDPL